MTNTEKIVEYFEAKVVHVVPGGKVEALATWRSVPREEFERQVDNTFHVFNAISKLKPKATKAQFNKAFKIVFGMNLSEVHE